jgi:hypothetical protein
VHTRWTLLSLAQGGFTSYNPNRRSGHCSLVTLSLRIQYPNTTLPLHYSLHCSTYSLSYAFRSLLYSLFYSLLYSLLYSLDRPGALCTVQ